MKAYTLLIGSIVWFCIPGMLFSQEDVGNLNSDELFLLARTKAFSSERIKAQMILKTLLARSPNYSEARILLGRIYAWEGQYDSARTELKAVLESDRSNLDASLAMIDVELWSDHSIDAMSVVDGALIQYPNNDELLVKKARVCKKLGRDEEALLLLTKAEGISPSNPDINQLREQIRLTSIRYSLTVNYTGDFFSQIYDPMHLSYVQLGRRTPLGTVFGRINYGDRFQTRGVQGEIDFYPVLRSGMYGYLNYGYSAISIFPKQRFGAELYKSLPSSFEGSLGLRYLYFGENSSVTIYTASATLYYGNYYFSLRPYITPNKGNFSRSISLIVRKYFSDADNYISMRGGIGFTPDERNIVFSSGTTGKETYFQKSQNIGAGWQFSYSKFYIISVTADMTHQELSFNPGNYFYDYTLSIGVKRIF